MRKWFFERSWERGGAGARRSAKMFTVRQGMRYRATVRLGWLEKFASNEMIAGKLREVGFSNVDVVGQGGVRTAEATWPGEDITGPLDSHLSDVTELSPAVGAASAVVAGGGVAMAAPAATPGDASAGATADTSADMSGPSDHAAAAPDQGAPASDATGPGATPPLAPGADSAATAPGGPANGPNGSSGSTNLPN